MIDFRRFYPKSVIVAVTVCLFVVAGFAQAPAPQPQAPPSPPAAPAAGQAPAPSTPAQANPVPSESTEHKITPEQAAQLFREVDDILKFASKETDLPIKKEVKRRLISRDEVVAYVTKHMMEDEDARRLRRSELVLKKFGLLPRDFDLETFLVALLREQVAGYYDPKAKTVNLLDWLDVEQQRPVMAHELTHALQDQSFGLEKWMKAGSADLGESKKEPTPADIDNDEISTARQAVVEGQAMAVLVDYMLAPSGQSLKDSPQIVETLKQRMLVGTADSVEFRHAPIYLKEALTFPYRYGMDFVAELLAHGGKEKAFAGAFLNPPRSTRQIMEPRTYLSGEQIAPMPLPDFKQDFKNYDRFDIGAIGEFDVALLVDQYAGVEASHAMYPHWRGGYYYAVRPKNDPNSSLGLLYVSRWSSLERSAEFSAIYAKSLMQRYKRLQQVKDPEKRDDDAVDLATLQTLVGRHVWLTEEGPVVIETKGDMVFIAEGLDEPTSNQLEREVFPASNPASH